MLSSSIGVSPGLDRRIDRQIGELELAARDIGGRAAEREVRRRLRRARLPSSSASVSAIARPDRP